MSEKNPNSIEFFESFQAQLESQLDQKRETEISSAIKSSILRLLILFDAENIKSKTEGFLNEKLFTTHSSLYPSPSYPITIRHQSLWCRRNLRIRSRR